VGIVEGVRSDTARETLRTHFGAQPSGENKLFVALSLAELGETLVVDTLLDAFEGDRGSGAVKNALTLLLVSEFDRETWGYRKLWDENTGKDQAFFLARAIGRATSGDAPFGAAGSAKEESFESIPVSSLVEALDSSHWYVRAAAARILETGAGETFGVVRRTTSPLELSQIRDSWRDWLRRR